MKRCSPAAFPPPLWGRDREGVRSFCVTLEPPPQPSPTRGEGARRASGPLVHLTRFDEPHVARNSSAVNRARNGRRAAAKVSVAPSSRSTIASTSTTLPPSALTASTAWMAEPPVVVASSTTTTFLPRRLSPLG